MVTAVKNPPSIYTTGDTLSNKTGTWRYQRPSFEKKVSPCLENCPAGNPIAHFMSLAARGNLKEALAAIKRENPLPAVCGRVCPHPCTSACNRKDFDNALAVNLVERLIGDAEAEYGLCLPTPAPGTGRKIAVIGAGPAGLSCAYQAAIMGHEVTIYEEAEKPGGLLWLGIPAYRLPRNVLQRELRFIDELKIKLQHSNKIGPEVTEALLEKFDAVCVAGGAHKPVKMGIEGEDFDHVFDGLRFLAMINAGHEIAVGKHVAVVGGGNTAIDAARAAVRMGAKEVSILYRRRREDMPASDEEIAEAKEEGVKFHFLTAPTKLIGKKDCLLSTWCIRMSPGEPDNSGRPRPVPIPRSEYQIKTDTLITAVGSNPIIPLNITGLSSADDWGATSHDKIFVCGDAAPGARTVAHAIGYGKRSAIAIDAKFNGKNLSEIKARINIGSKSAVSAELYRTGESAPDPKKVVGFADINIAYFTKSEPVKLDRLGKRERIKNFHEVNRINVPETAQKEAARCFHCGACNDCGNCLLYCPDMSILEKTAETGTPGFHSDYCKGCGICARECPRGIIAMIEEGK
jgi:NADPH-dependent glutamate synthase beta subunit-like oxidoreductase/Pyruvate/2-oxoacid:ferredoxin oxidoreductase delta subunit